MFHAACLARRKKKLVRRLKESRRGKSDEEFGLFTTWVLAVGPAESGVFSLFGVDGRPAPDSPPSLGAVRDGQVREVADARHGVAEPDAGVARRRLHAQLVVEVAAVAPVPDHVHFVYKNARARVSDCARERDNEREGEENGKKMSERRNTVEGGNTRFGGGERRGGGQRRGRGALGQRVGAARLHGHLAAAALARQLLEPPAQVPLLAVQLLLELVLAPVALLQRLLGQRNAR